MPPTISWTCSLVRVAVIYPAPFVIALLFNEIFALPSKLTPAIVLADANFVAVAAFPVHEPDDPEALPVTFPTNPPEAVTAPLKVAAASSASTVNNEVLSLDLSKPRVLGPDL